MQCMRGAWRMQTGEAGRRRRFSATQGDAQSAMEASSITLGEHRRRDAELSLEVDQTVTRPSSSFVGWPSVERVDLTL